MQQQDIFVNRSVESTLNRRDHTLDRALRQRAQSVASKLGPMHYPNFLTLLW